MKSHTSTSVQTDAELGLDDAIIPRPYLPGAPASVSIPPASALPRSARMLNAKINDIPGVIGLDETYLEEVARLAVDLGQVRNPHLNPVRVRNGYAITLGIHGFVTLVQVAPDNDRNVGETIYPAASPKAERGRGIPAVPSQQPIPGLAALKQTGESATILDALRQTTQRRMNEGMVSVGRRPIEQPLTIVMTCWDVAGLRGTMAVAKDGNGRALAAQTNLQCRAGDLPNRIVTPLNLKATSAMHVEPALLAQLSPAERISLTRRILTAATKRLDQPPVSDKTSAKARRKDREERNRAATMLNSLIAPMNVVVGFIPDDDTVGFDRVVRAYLEALNVEPVSFSAASRRSVSGEEIVTDAVAQGTFTPDLGTIMLGRESINEPMKRLGLDPQFPELRAAAIVHGFTQSDSNLKAIMRDRMSLTSGGVQPNHRTEIAVPLCMRSYGHLDSSASDSMRKALDSGMIWQALVSEDWSLRPVNTKDEIKALLDDAVAEDKNGPRPNRLLLGVLGMFALTSTGGLLAPAGSAQPAGAATFDRGRVAGVVDKLTGSRWGLHLLADAVLQSRRLARPRRLVSTTVAPEKFEFVETAAASEVNVWIRCSVSSPDAGDPALDTPDLKQAAMLRLMEEDTNALTERVRELLTLRRDESLPRLAQGQTDPIIGGLDRLSRAMRGITDYSTDAFDLGGDL